MVVIYARLKGAASSFIEIAQRNRRGFCLAKVVAAFLVLMAMPLSLYSMEKGLVDHSNAAVATKQIYALASLEKGDERVYWVGVAYDTPLVVKENNEEQIFIDFLHRYTAQFGGIALFVPATIDLCKAKCRQMEFPVAFKGSKPRLLDRIMQMASESVDNELLKGVTFELAAGDPDESIVNKMQALASTCDLRHFPFFARLAGIQEDLAQLESKLALDEKFRRAFFAPQGALNALIEYIKKTLKRDGMLLKVKDFWECFFRRSALLEDKGISEAQIFGLVMSLESNLKTHENEGPYLIDVLAGYIRAKKSIAAGLQDFTVHVLSAWDQIQHTLLKTQPPAFVLARMKHKRIITFVNISDFEKTVKGYEKLGFSLCAYNSTDIPHLPEESEAFVLPAQTGFSEKDLKAIFNSWITESGPVGLSIIKNKPIFINQNSFLPQNDPHYKVDRFCKTCAHALRPAGLIIESENHDTYCSSNCFVRSDHSLSSSFLFQLLDENKELSKEDIFVLQRCCFILLLRIHSLDLSALIERSYLYTIDHAQWLAELKRIEQIIEGEHSAGDRIVEILNSLGITLNDLIIFFDMYARVKKSYLESAYNCFLAKKSTSYEDLGAVPIPLFDQRLILKKRQDDHQFKIKKALKLSQDTKNEAVAYLLKWLAHRILEKVGPMLFESTVLFEDRPTVSPAGSQLSEFEQQLSPQAAPLRQKSTVHKESHRPLMVPLNEESESDEEQETRMDDLRVAHEIDPSAEGFAEHTTRRPRPKEACIMDRLLDYPYAITLYRVRDYLPRQEKLQAKRVFNACGSFDYHLRIKKLFTIADMLKLTGGAHIGFGSHGIPIIEPESTMFDATIKEKLDLGHLFSSQVDRYLHSFGVVEFENDRIKVSIPGELMYGETLRIGFFQYTFIPKDWTCIHRCFVNYDSHAADNLFVSKMLRRALYDFLKENKQDDSRYQGVRCDLARLCSDI